MTDLKLSERIRVRAALFETVNLSLSREQALAIVKMLEREADLVDTLQSLIVDTEARERRRDKLAMVVAIQCAAFCAASTWFIGILSYSI